MVATWTATSSSKENPSFDPMMCQKLGAIYPILEGKLGGLEEKTHPTGGTKFENLIVKGMKVDLFTLNVQRSLVDSKLLRRAEVPI